MDGLLPLIGAGLAVLALVALSAWLGFRGQPRLGGSDEAVALAAELSRGFAASRLALDRDGAAALVEDAQGRIALVAPHGAHFIAREIGPATRLVRDDDALSISIGSLQARLVLGEEARDWEAAIARAIGLGSAVQ